jgi:hypothetical protein
LTWTQGNAPAGTYTIAYGSVSGYTAPAPETQTLVAGDSITFAGNYQPVGYYSGDIFVVTDLPNSTFNITGPASYSGPGKLWIQSNVPPGIYSIAYNPVSGYTTPASQTLTLTAGGTLTFSSNYGPPASTGTILVRTNLSGATFVLSGPDYIQGSGSFFSKSNAGPGTYTLTFSAFPGNLRDAVPMPPLKPKATVPVPAPTAPSSTEPLFAPG